MKGSDAKKSTRIQLPNGKQTKLQVKTQET